MPNQPATFNKTVRIEGDLWDRAGQVAGAQGTTRAGAINAFLRWYTGQDDAKLPEPATRTDNGRAGHAEVIDRYIETRLAELGRLRADAHAALARGVDIDDILDHVEEAGRHVAAAGLRVAKLEARRG